MGNSLRVSFPLKGLDENWAMSGQPPLTSPDLQNVRPRDVQDKRSCGGQRPAVRKIMYWWDYPGEGGDLGLPANSPIIGLTQVTAVYYASIAGDSGTSYVDPTGGDPLWDGIVLLMANDFNHEIQIYSFTGNPIKEVDLSIGAMTTAGVVVDKYGHIYAAVGDSGDEHTVFKFKYDGTILDLADYNAVSLSVAATNKKDGVVFVNTGNTLRALNAGDLDTTIWSKYTGMSDFNEIVQLINSDDLILPFYTFSGTAVKRVNRIDGSTVTSYVGDGSAMTVAVDEENNWLYKGGGDRAATKDYVYRFNLATGDFINRFELTGGNIKKLVLHDDKVYAAGERADDNNTIWKLDAALAGIEADYDTGDTVNDMRITSNGTVYVVGINAQNEDLDTGNVNVLTSALAYVESWSVRAGGTILKIANKVL